MCYEAILDLTTCLQRVVRCLGMSAKVIWDLDAVAALARETLQCFRRDVFNHGKETCEICGREILLEQIAKKPCGDPSLRRELRGNDSPAVRRLPNPAREHPTLCDQVNLRFKLVIAHIARILNLTKQR